MSKQTKIRYIDVVKAKSIDFAHPYQNTLFYYLNQWDATNPNKIQHFLASIKHLLLYFALLVIWKYTQCIDSKSNGSFSSTSKHEKKGSSSKLIFFFLTGKVIFLFYKYFHNFLCYVHNTYSFVCFAQILYVFQVMFSKYTHNRLNTLNQLK